VPSHDALTSCPSVGVVSESGLPSVLPRSARVIPPVVVPWTEPAVLARTLFSNIPFRYNRFKAAQKAVALAAQGDRSSQSDGVVDGIAFQTTLGATDSARFISLSLRAGGIPMVTTGQQNVCDPSSYVGWCVAPPVLADSPFLDNPVWRNHNVVNTIEDIVNPVNLPQDTGLAAFLLANPVVLGTGIRVFYWVGGVYVDTTTNYATVSIDNIIGKNSSGLTYYPGGFPSSQNLEDARYSEIASNLNSTEFAGDADDADMESVMIDSTIVRAHPCAAGAQKKRRTSGASLGAESRWVEHQRS
jgi:hypothetical protein